MDIVYDRKDSIINFIRTEILITSKSFFSKINK